MNRSHAQRVFDAVIAKACLRYSIVRRAHSISSAIGLIFHAQVPWILMTYELMSCFPMDMNAFPHLPRRLRSLCLFTVRIENWMVCSVLPCHAMSWYDTLLTFRSNHTRFNKVVSFKIVHEN